MWLLEQISIFQSTYAIPSTERCLDPLYDNVQRVCVANRAEYLLDVRIRLSLELTRFRGHIMLCVQGVANVQSTTAVPSGIPPAGGRVGRSPAQLSREFGVTSQSITNWVGQAAIDDGKPLPDKEGLTTAEREELVRLRRQLRQVQMERDILAKATAWFAGRSDATSMKSSDS